MIPRLARPVSVRTVTGAPVPTPRARVRTATLTLALAVGLTGVPPAPLATSLAAQELMPVCEDGFAFDHSLGPTFNSAPSFGERFGGRVEASLCATGINELFGLNGWHGLALAGRALLADHDVVTPDASEARATLVLGLGLFTVNEVEIDLSADPTADPTDDEQGLVTSYGFVELGGTASYEESVDRAERGFTGGAVVRYGHERKAWVPSLSLRFEVVRPTSSAARRAAGVDEEDTHSRLTTDVYWSFPLRFVSTALEDFRLGAEGSWFHTSGVASELTDADDDWESGGVVAGSVGWMGDAGLLGGLSLRDVSFRYAAGHRGTDPVDRDGLRVIVGLAFGS